MRYSVFAAMLFFAVSAQAVELDGVVTANNHSCSVDAICSFTVKTADGKEASFVYGQEMPIAGCVMGKFSDAAWKFVAGDKVHVSAPDRFKETFKDGVSYDLCDEGSSLGLLP